MDRRGLSTPLTLIEPEELEDSRAIGMATYADPSGETGFRFPCNYLDGACCTRYEQWRPSVCSGFLCAVQLKVKKGAMTPDDARAKVRKARLLRDSVAAVLPEGDIMATAVLRYLMADESDVAGSTANLDLTVRMFVLQRYLDAEFRPKRDTAPDSDPVP
ncbi:hypothetical protein [Novosphingobium sp. B1]|uniref:hypothetical protein n=1 Tax=Novosphingobium sp. B1 TaxID=1938756 RepID=UPI0009D8CBD1|nr:hypothetical protein [Novosphingobium sp. B1]SMD06658.1 hypothetical protein SAMN06272759_13218 [Novosphingobium sp. B1]